jgi:hypothetical protein
LLRLEKTRNSLCQKTNFRNHDVPFLNLSANCSQSC